MQRHPETAALLDLIQIGFHVDFGPEFFSGGQRDQTFEGAVGAVAAGSAVLVAGVLAGTGVGGSYQRE